MDYTLSAAKRAILLAMLLCSSAMPATAFAAPNAAPAAPAPDPFNANAYRVERDNLREKPPAAGTATTSAAAPAPYSFAAAQAAKTAPAPRHVPWQNTQVVRDWEYLENATEDPDTAAAATGWKPVSVPHTWNARDTLEKAAYRRDASWYRHKFTFAKDDARLHRFFLRFGAAGQSAVIYVNGRETLTHHGGYSAFTVPLGKPDEDGEVTVLARVSNAKNRHLPPLSGDFNQYGGLYRETRLLRAPTEFFFARDLDGGAGVEVASHTAADASSATLTLRVSTGEWNTSELVTAKVTVTAPDGTEVASETFRPDGVRPASTRADGSRAPAAKPSRPAPAPATVTLTIPKPLLWSPAAPALYTVTVAASTGDTVVLRHGFRTFAFTPDNGFFLNGRPFKLLGVNRHQDCPGLGNALPDALHDADLRRIKEAGFNFVRLAHYQQDDYVLQRCDALGLLVWEEIPLVNVVTPRRFPPSAALAENSRSMLREMLAQHRHHPSVIIWGLGNEISFTASGDTIYPEHHKFERELIAGLHRLAKELDASRATILVSHDSDRAFEAGHMSVPDLNGYNLYKGWYRDTFEKLSTRLAEIHAKNPTKPVLLSEWGAGADPWIHSETPRRYDQSEEYMLALLENYRDQFDAPPLRFLAANIQWVFADFGAAHRIDTHPYVNNKGLLDTDRQPKDAYFYIKARQQRGDPFVYLQTPAWTRRGGVAEKNYRVFSNMDTVELFHNGTSLGKRRRLDAGGRGFQWRVVLRPGANVLLAKGVNDGSASMGGDGAGSSGGGGAGDIGREHGFTVTYDPALPPRIAPVMPKH
ncbi:MAG: glycoside hydrolase family 2 protein [Puniceicoccales bacterium]|jgi:beta-galactosidase|nr:glycoside hydrolase family 2 protein [Puniceicoccales bacterium]